MNDVNSNDDEDVVTKALRKARYNEIVHISIETTDGGDVDGDVNYISKGDKSSTKKDDDGTTNTNEQTPSSPRKSISLIPRLNEQQGGVQFINVLDLVNVENDPNHCIDEKNSTDCTGNRPNEASTADDATTIILQKELQTKRWFFPMLNDTHRNQSYYSAITKAIQHVMNHTHAGHRAETKNIVYVLDIGSGSGLLSMMFAKAFSNYCSSSNDIEATNTIYITSVEMSDAFGTLALRTLEENTTLHYNPKSCIHIHPGQHSTALTFNSNKNYSPLTATSDNSNDNHVIQYDICISELFEHGLFGEGWIPTVRDAWSRHLSSSSSSSSLSSHKSLIIPCGAKVYGAIVQSSWLNDYCRPLHTPYEFSTYNQDGTQQKHHSLSMDLRKIDDDDQYLIDTCHVQLPIHINKLIRDRKIAIVSNTALIFNVDVTSPYTVPALEGQSVTVKFAIESTTGSSNDIVSKNDRKECNSYSVLIWWDMILWEDRENGNNIIYSLQPNEQTSFQDHWCPCLHVLPNDNAIIFDNEAKSSVDVTFRHDDYRIYVDDMKLHASSSCESVDESKMGVRHCRVKRIKTETNENNEHLIVARPLPPAYISQERSFQLNDHNRIRIFQKSLERAIQYKNKQKCAMSSVLSNDKGGPSSNSNVIMDVSDFSLGACIAATICHTMTQDNDYNRFTIVSVENSSGHLPALASQVLSNSIPTNDHSKRVEVSVLQCYNENVTLDVIGNGTKTVDITFSEPYYEVLEGWHLQEALNFYYTVRLLRRNGIIDQETIVLPSICRIMGCILESSDLRNTYGPCGDNASESIHGIQHKYINRVGRNGRGYNMSIPMWQYDYKVLSHPFEVGTLHYMDPNAPNIPEETTVSASFRVSGRCDALFVWLEYDFSLPSAADLHQKVNDAVLSTNCQSYNQMVQMLDRSIDVSNLEMAHILCRATFGGNKFESHRFDVQINRC